MDGGADTGLMGEDGAVEAGRGRFSVEPFLWSGGRLLRWSDVETSHALEKGYLPIPSVTWHKDGLSLQVLGFGSGPAAAPVFRCRYRVANGGARPWKGTLFLALRPFQVNPAIQFLGTPGGVATLKGLAREGAVIKVDGRNALAATPAPDAFGAAAFDQGDITGFLSQGKLPQATAIEDPEGRASGALRYDLELPAGAARDIVIDLPLPGDAVAALPPFAEDLAATARAWDEKLNRIAIRTPDRVLDDTVRSCLAHLLVSRRGPALQPGTRSYARSWIRDGAIISSALLQMGHPDEVRDFIRWYAPNQFATGRIPCVVDPRGADPVPENDSNGEFLYLLAEHARFTRDLSLVREFWPNVIRACDFIEAQTALRRTPAYQTGEKARFYGLMPESISHEGYSARPMHSYWDDFFTLRGLKDAAEMAGRLGETGLQIRYAALEDRFRVDLLASLRATMARFGIDYLPGCADLGDFDATSTTVAISPGGELECLPRPAVEATFERFYREFAARRDGAGKDGRYTPYETRAIGTMVELGWTARAHELIAAYLRDRRPAAWNQWPEVVQRDPRAPLFLGDLPHAWVEADFLRSVMTLFAYEREADRTLVVGGGLTEGWLRDPAGVAVTGLRVPSGSLDFRARLQDGKVVFELSGKLDLPPGGIAVRWPLAGAFRAATLDGAAVHGTSGLEVVIRALPARITMER